MILGYKTIATIDLAKCGVKCYISNDYYPRSKTIMLLLIIKFTKCQLILLRLVRI